jgi:hypothetical protein
MNQVGNLIKVKNYIYLLDIWSSGVLHFPIDPSLCGGDRTNYIRNKLAIFVFISYTYMLLSDMTHCICGCQSGAFKINLDVWNQPSFNCFRILWNLQLIQWDCPFQLLSH